MSSTHPLPVRYLTGVLLTWATVGRPPHGDYEYILWTVGG